MRKKSLQTVSTVIELPVWGDGRLPSGIVCSKHVSADVYLASKEDLIAAGLAKPAWFPTLRLPGKRPGTTKRQFKIPTDHGTASLTEQPRLGRWQLQLPVSDEDRASRDEEWERHREAKRQKEERATQAREVARRATQAELSEKAFRSLPTFVPGSMTEAEKAHMRALRGLDDSTRKVLMNLPYDLLAHSSAAEQAAKTSTIQRRLSLVVNNKEARHG